jgi:hypothetical protein
MDAPEVGRHRVGERVLLAGDSIAASVLLLHVGRLLVESLGPAADFDLVDGKCLLGLGFLVVPRGPSFVYVG